MQGVIGEELRKKRTEYYGSCKEWLVKKGYCDESDDPFSMKPLPILPKISWGLKDNLEVNHESA